MKSGGELFSDGVFVSLTDGLGVEAHSFFSQNSVDYYSSIEIVTGSNYNDMLIGDKSANTIRGLAGFDLIEGLGGAVIVHIASPHRVGAGF